MTTSTTCKKASLDGLFLNEHALEFVSKVRISTQRIVNFAIGKCKLIKTILLNVRAISAKIKLPKNTHNMLTFRLKKKKLSVVSSQADRAREN